MIQQGSVCCKKRTSVQIAISFVVGTFHKLFREVFKYGLNFAKTKEKLPQIVLIIKFVFIAIKQTDITIKYWLFIDLLN